MGHLLYCSLSSTRQGICIDADAGHVLLSVALEGLATEIVARSQMSLPPFDTEGSACSPAVQQVGRQACGPLLHRSAFEKGTAEGGSSYSQVRW